MSSCLEVKRVYDVCRYIFSGEGEYVLDMYHIFSQNSLILNYRWKNVIRLEGVDYASDKGLSWQGLGKNVRHVEVRRYMMYLDVSFL